METFDFGWAIRTLKAGKCVARKGWNGKGMWLFIKRSEDASMRPYIIMKTADNTFVPWLASQTDMLGEDWILA